MEYDKENKPIIKTHEDLIEYQNILIQKVLEKQRLKKLEKLNPKPIKKK